MKKPYLIIGIGVLFFIAIAYWSQSVISKAEREKLAALEGVNHHEVITSLLPDSLQAFTQGRSMVVNAWATWCGPCLMEIPDLNEIVAEADPSRFFFLAISNEEPAVYDKFLEQKPDFVFDYQKIFGDMALVEYIMNLDIKGGGQSIPIHILITPEGRVDQVLIGASPANISKIKAFVGV